MEENNQFRFVSFAEAAKIAEDMARRIPNIFDLIAGVPRSGVWLAAYLACLYGRPLYIVGNGEVSREFTHFFFEENNVNRILLVDDSSIFLNTIGRAEEELKKIFKNSEIKKAVLIIEPNLKDKVDYFGIVANRFRIFEWNLAHAKKGSVAFDIDGVLCPDPPSNLEYEDEMAYRQYLEDATPFILPKYEIDLIVSCRLEKYRWETENWLKKKKIKYKELVLWNLNDPRMRAGKHGEYKAKIINSRKIDYVVESSSAQAKIIAEMTEKPVISVEDMKLY